MVAKIITERKINLAACLWILISGNPPKVYPFILWRNITHLDLTGFDTVIEWVVNYFTEKLEGDVNDILRAASPVVATGKMPVIMQYEGHSVTIVGYEVGKNNKYSLLALNPSR